VAIFDNLLINPPASLWSSVPLPGLWTKGVAVGLLYVPLLLVRRPHAFIAVYCLQIVYMVVNLSYHFYFEGYLHVNQYLGLFSEALDLVKHSAVPRDAVLWFVLIDAPLFALILFKYSPVVIFNRRHIIKKAFFALGIVLIIYAYEWDAIGKGETALGIMNDAYSSNSRVVSKYGLFVFNIMDLLNYKDARSHIKSLDYGGEISLPAADSTHPNFIVLQVESMDSYIVNCRYKANQVMPFLHSLSKQSVYYPYTLSYHKAGSTSDCEFSTINGVEPFDDYPSIKIRNYDYPNSMLKPLTSAGYRTVAFHGNKGTYFNRNVAFKKMGFSAFYDMTSMGLTERVWGAPDGDVFNYVKGALATQKAPFFYYLITMSSHEPFNFVKSYYHTDLYDAIADEASRNYYTAMSYVDGQIKDLVEYVCKTKDNTYIIIYGDHAPIIKKSFYKRASFIADARLFEFVPLFIMTPGKTIYRENKRIASFLDVAPTLLTASKIAFSIKSSGSDLLAAPRGREKIMYSGGEYSRTDLFSRIQRAQREPMR
jgi:phosphoglycerol transferase MdoB-like AlkP superfamily enzyme